MSGNRHAVNGLLALFLAAGLSEIVLMVPCPNSLNYDNNYQIGLLQHDLIVKFERSLTRTLKEYFAGFVAFGPGRSACRRS